MVPDAREDCYQAALHIANADLHDSRPYYLVVENDRGIDRQAIHLSVEGSFAGALSFSILVGWLVDFRALCDVNEILNSPAKQVTRTKNLKSYNAVHVKVA